MNVNGFALLVLSFALLLTQPAGAATVASTNAGDAASGLSCPPDFLTGTESQMVNKDGSIRSGPWHARCFQNGMAIFDRDRLYVMCRKDSAHASIEGADGHAIRFQFPADIACVWER